MPLPSAWCQSSSADSAQREPPGPSSRRTPLVISEIMYHPIARPDSNNLEYVELYNSQPWPEDVSGFRWAGAMQFTFPPGTVLPAEGVMVVAADPAAMRAMYGVTNVVGPYTGTLGNASGEIRLLNRAGALVLTAAYATEPPWPASADGAGHSLVLARPSWGEGHARAWAASDMKGGSPGRQETVAVEPLRSVGFNEVLVHTTDPEPDFVELYNHANTPADLSGCHLTDDPTTNKFTFPSQTTLEGRGFLSLNQTTLGFALSSGGETVYLLNSSGSRVLDALRFGPQERDVAYGRSPDGLGAWNPLAGPTPGQANSGPREREIVINEIMYAPVSGDLDDQFIELHNRGGVTVNLSGWRFVAGIDFHFPSNTTLPPGGYLVVARNAARLRTHYTNLGGSNLVGDFGGRLSGRGERLALAMPETIARDVGGQPTTNIEYVVVDELTYGTGGQWGLWADGGGSSLELIDPRGDNRLAANWADSDESAKAPWTIVQHTGRLDHGSGTPNALHLLLLGAGECLVDDVEVLNSGGVNLLSNPGFSAGLSPWTPQGDHETSSLQATGGWNDSPCLRLRAQSDGDTGANKIRTPLTSSLTINADATLRARVRWLRGHPEILLRTAGNYLEAFGELSVPWDLGTPGARNSRFQDEAGPLISAVQHQPILPAAGQAVTVTARIDDPDGLAWAVVRYRVDPNTNNVMTVPLVDDGSGGDAVAGDGLYSGVLPGQGAGALIAYHVAAADRHNVARTLPGDAPARECLVRFGESQPAGSLGTYRLWFTQETFNRWTSRLKLSNARLDATFVSGNQRVIYNAGALYAGSAYHSERYTSPTGVACDYKIVLPTDDPFLGSDELTVVWPGLTGGDPVDNTAQQEQTCYWLAGALGLPFNYQRYVHFFVNGTRRSFIMQDTQKPDRDLLRQWFPSDSDGDLYKVQIWREYNDAATATTTAVGATLGQFTSLEGKKTARYRWAWTPRGSGRSLNRFSPLFALVDAVNSPSNTYTGAVQAAVDTEQWMRTFALEHLVGNWDSYGYGNGQNLYAYKPEGDRWKMLLWDLDVALGTVSDPPTSDLFKLTNPFFPSLNGDPAVIDRMYKHPGMARAYWRAVQEAAQGPLVSSNLNAFLDARFAALTANGVSLTAPDSIKTYLNTRRTYVLGRLATVSAAFGVQTPPAFSTTNNLVLLSGTAPVDVRDITINGVLFPVTWNSVTSWTATVVVGPGQTELAIQGLDREGRPIPAALQTNTVTYTGPNVAPEEAIVINEIMHHPSLPGAAYVELANVSASSFDLSSWRLNGVDFVFPPGSILTAGQHLVLAENRGAFAAAYGAGVPVHGEFQGILQLDGETLTVMRPGAAPGEEWVVDKVRYEAATPWPQSAAGQGASLQLIDAHQDNSRVSNWSGRAPSPGATNASVATLPAYPSLWLNEVQPLNLTGLVDNAGQRGPWVELHQAGTEPQNLEGYYLSDTYSNLTQWPFPPGASLAGGEFKVVWADGAPGETTTEAWHTSFRLNPLAGSVALVRLVNSTPQIVDYLNYGGLAADQSFGAVPDGQPFSRRLLFGSTPGQSNAEAEPALAVYINEWMASNVSPDGFQNPAGGGYDDWFELFNPGGEPAELGGYFLTDDVADPFQFQIPAGYSIPARGYLLVWADGQPARNSTNSPDLHANFQLARDGEAIALFAPNGFPVDAVRFGSQTNNVSQGRFPDGASGLFFMDPATPRASNMLAEGGAGPVFTGIGRSPQGEIVLSWQTRQGEVHRVEYTSDLTAGSWMTLGDYAAHGTTLTIVDPVGATSRRFYRIVLRQP